MATFPDHFTDSLLALTNLMIAEESLDDTLQRIVSLACQTMPACQHASLTLQRPRGPETAAATDDVAARSDATQYEAGDGPCLTACRTGEVVRIPDLAGEDRWPAFVATAQQAGVRSVLSMPLDDGTRTIGAMNLYADGVGAFTADDEELGAVFGRQSAVAIGNSEVYWRTYELTQNLRAALETRDVIGQAKGILMARQKITGDDAFDLLRHASQSLNRKLRDIADEVVSTGQLPTA